MGIETVAVLISFAVLVLQVIQMMRYVRLEGEVKRVTTELDQTLNRLQRALELTREIYVGQILYHRFHWPLLNEINKDGQARFWGNQAKYEHVRSEAEAIARLNSFSLELEAIAGTVQDLELGELALRIGDWIDNPQLYSETPLGEFHSLVQKTEERIYRLIDKRLSPKKAQDAEYSGPHHRV